MTRITSFTDRELLRLWRQDCILMAAFMLAGSILCCMAGFTVMNMVFGLAPLAAGGGQQQQQQPDDFDEARDDPDFELYTRPGPHWSEEIDYYGQRLNQTMEPICCHDFGEGQVWGDERR